MDSSIRTEKIDFFRHKNYYMYHIWAKSEQFLHKRRTGYGRVRKTAEIVTGLSKNRVTERKPDEVPRAFDKYFIGG